MGTARASLDHSDLPDISSDERGLNVSLNFGAARLPFAGFSDANANAEQFRDSIFAVAAKTGVCVMPSRGASARIGSSDCSILKCVSELSAAGVSPVQPGDALSASPNRRKSSQLRHALEDGVMDA
jgi:hypothetical protein